jgi:uncharacterized protein YbaR (Trm112 family)
MHVDLVESLRCPSVHADGWLVAAADVTVARRIVRGTLDCPQCGREWRITDGELDFDAGPDDGPGADPDADADAEADADADAHADAGLAAPRIGRTDTSTDARRAAALRTAALLDLREPHACVLLTGASSCVAEPLGDLTHALVLAINAPAGAAETHSRLRSRAPVRLGVGCLQGAGLDAAHADAAWLAAVVPAVRRGGRVVAPAHVPLPDGLRELARDEHEWVAEVQVAASGLVPLRRGGDPLAR